MSEVKKITMEEFMKEYGDTIVKFSSYYKYEFTFYSVEGTVDGHGIRLVAGGNADDIYRFDVYAHQEYKASELYPRYAYVFRDDTIVMEAND
jgi:hypothetical protein